MALGLAAVLAVVVAAALTAAGCDRTPTAPSVVVDLGPPWIVALWIEPGEMFELEIGEEEQLTACVEYSDDRRDCEIEAEWLTDGPEASVVNGLVRGELPGLVWVSAKYAEKVCRERVGPVLCVVEEFDAAVLVRVTAVGGAWLLSGHVQDAGTGRFVWGATVSVRGGLFDGMSSTTGSYGWYRLTDVGGRLQLAVTAAGYRDETAVVDVTRRTTHDFTLIPQEEH